MTMRVAQLENKPLEASFDFALQTEPRRSQPSSRSYPCAASDISCFHDLASQAGTGIMTVRQIQAGTTKPRTATLIVLRQVLERAGVEFIDENDCGPGV